VVDLDVPITMPFRKERFVPLTMSTLEELLGLPSNTVSLKLARQHP